MFTPMLYTSRSNVPSFNEAEINGELAFQEFMNMSLEQALAIATTPQSDIDNTTAIQMIGAMHRLGDDIFKLMESDGVAYKARRQLYYDLRDTLEARYPDMPAHLTDPWTFEIYSEMYKDRYGSRPSSYITGPEARAWCNDPQREIEAAE